jgi:hypothetical protein
MPLKLPNNEVLADDEVRETLSRYQNDCPAVLDLFDATIGEPHDELLPIDVLSLNALNAFGAGSPMTAMTAAWVDREKVTAAVKPITKVKLESLTPMEVKAVTIPMPAFKQDLKAALIHTTDAKNGWAIRITGGAPPPSPRRPMPMACCSWAADVSANFRRASELRLNPTVAMTGRRNGRSRVPFERGVALYSRRGDQIDGTSEDQCRRIARAITSSLSP